MEEKVFIYIKGSQTKHPTSKTQNNPGNLECSALSFNGVVVWHHIAVNTVFNGLSHSGGKVPTMHSPQLNSQCLSCTQTFHSAHMEDLFTPLSPKAWSC